MEIRKELWGKSACGKEIYLYTLTNEKGAYVQLSSVGAAIVSAVVPDKDGNMADVVLGYDVAESYFGDGPCLGKIPGRYANRIALGHFTLDGVEYQLTCNDGNNTLHGGKFGFNSKIWGVEDADAILIVGSNPRHEAAVLNARIRKQWLRSDLEVAVVGQPFESTFEFEHLGTDAAAVKSALAGPFGKKLQSAKRPMIIVGSGVTDHDDAKAIYEAVGSFVDKNANFHTEEWNGYNVLQRAASRAGAYEVGFTTPSPEVTEITPKFVWLLAADEINAADIPKNAFVVYQGHHGDKGAALADVVLPGAAYTEKAGTYVNTEGRVQMTRAATSLPGAARTDWKIIRAASEFLGAPLPYDDAAMLRDRMVEISPALASYDIVEPTSVAQLAKVQLVDQNKGSKPTGEPFKKVFDNFYFTDVISRRYVQLLKLLHWTQLISSQLADDGTLLGSKGVG